MSRRRIPDRQDRVQRARQMRAEGAAYDEIGRAVEVAKITAQRWCAGVKKRVPTPPERFWAKVDKDGPVPQHASDLGPCWVWTAYRNPGGYGCFDHGLAHRWSYMEANGPLPEDRPELDHLCRNPACVRPSHLEPVTGRINCNRTRLAERFASNAQRARELADAGMGTTAIARDIGVSNKMVRQYLDPNLAEASRARARAA